MTDHRWAYSRRARIGREWYLVPALLMVAAFMSWLVGFMRHVDSEFAGDQLRPQPHFALDGGDLGVIGLVFMATAVVLSAGIAFMRRDTD
ncbi:hypothetical protein ACIBSV_49590 [Embleya sp. NPDC050154]|uniref:hypothetical protein n=1 Tax=unclassified Embleya TaxID=2699296 RepID=UPI0037BDC430